MSPPLCFGGFRLDPGNAALSRDGQPVPLPPKAFAVLVFLCQRAGRLVTKDELLDGVWGRHHISEGVIKNTIQELRQALGDTPKAARYIETVHRRGYRFVAEIGAPGHEVVAPGPEAPPSRDPDTLLVGREDPLGQIRRCLELARQGQGQVVFLSGEPGIGKTSLIRAFAREQGADVLWVVGQCVEQYGQSEPYLPVLEALGQLAQRSGEACLRCLGRYAPTWLAQMPWLLEEPDRQGLVREGRSATQTRMLRELGAFLAAWTETQPLLLVLEDLHWSDHATLDAINYLSRQSGLRLMLLGSYRPVDVLVNDHPFRQLRNELLPHKLCLELHLELLSEAAVNDYLEQRFGSGRFSEPGVRSIHRRTEGLPLFLARLTDEIDPDRAGDVEQALAALPDGLKHLIERQFDRLPPREQRWLEIAAVCGSAFPLPLLAELAAVPMEELEAWCGTLARSHQLLRLAPADGRASDDYAFIHAFYREQVHARIPTARRIQLHAQAGAWLETAWGAQARDNAAHLAMHFEAGRCHEAAVKYLHLAALNALGRNATHEAAALLERGIRLADAHLPDTPERLALSLEMQVLLPPALIATRGYTEPGLPDIYRRTLQLAERAGNARIRYATLYGTWVYHVARGELHVALPLARQLATLSEQDAPPTWRVAADLALGSTLMFMGENLQPDHCFESGSRLAPALESAGNQLARHFGQDPLASLLAFRALVQNILGRPGHSLALLGAAQARAEALGHPYTQTFILFCAVWLYRDRGEPERVRAYLPRFEALATAHGFPVMVNTARVFAGWLAASQDRDPAGLAQMEQALAELERAQMRLTVTVHHHQVADANLKLGRLDAALAANDTALRVLEETGERRYEAETWRLRGDVLAALATPARETPAKCYRKALAVARAQGALLFELRAATGLLRQARDPAARREAMALLEASLGRHDEGEGENTVDLERARALLEQPAV